MRNLPRAPFVVALLVLACTPAAAGQEPGPEPRLAEGYWTRGLAAGWGHAWKHGVPGYGKTESDVRFAAFHPQLGRFVTDHLELYGEGTLLVYAPPAPAVSAGLAAVGGRYHVWSDRSWTPYAVGIAGLLWTRLAALLLKLPGLGRSPIRPRLSPEYHGRVGPAAANVDTRYRDNGEGILGTVGNVYQDTQTALAAFAASISPALIPSTDPRISSVCSPSSGDRTTSAGESDSLMGLPTVRYFPRVG